MRVFVFSLVNSHSRKIAITGRYSMLIRGRYPIRDVDIRNMQKLRDSNILLLFVINFPIVF